MAEAERIEGNEKVITLGGRSFEPAQRISFGHHAWMMSRVRRAGVFEPGMDADEFLLRVLESGRAHELLAGSFDEVGVEWTEERAEKNANFFYNLTDPSDIQRLQSALAGVLASFFLLTGGLSKISPSSLNASPAGDIRLGASEESLTSENSASSSASSPDSIPSAPEKS